MPIPPLAILLGPFEVRLGLAVGLLALLAAAEVVTTWALGRLGLRGRGRAARLRPAAALALPLLLLAPRLEGHELLVPSHPLRVVPGVPDLGAGPWDLLNDAVFQFLPWEAEVRRALADGHLPLWSDRLQSSPWSNPQAQVLAPVALAARLFPLEHFLLAALALKLLLAFDGAWALAAAVGVRPAFRHLAGVSFAFGGGLMAWALFPQSSALALTPWLVAAAVRLARSRGRRGARDERLAAVLATAGLAVGGHPEVAAAGGALAALAALGFRRRAAPLGPALARLAAAAGLGLALAAPAWLPFAAEVGESQRFVELAGLGPAAPGARGERPGGWFHPAHVAMLRAPLGPEVFGRPYFGAFRGPFNWVWAEGGYAGLAALAGTLAALAAHATRRRALPLALFALVALLASARFAPLAALVEAIRPLRAVALERALPVATLALAVAGALGVERIARRTAGRARSKGGLAARGPRLALRLSPALVAAALATIASLAAGATPRTLVAWVLLAAAAGLAVHRRRLAAVALAVGLVVDLGLFARDFLPAGFARQLWPPSPLLQELVRRGAGAPFRVAALDRLAYPASLAMHTLEDVRVHDPLADQRYLDVTAAAFGFAPSTQEYFDAFELRDRRIASFLGLRFLVARAAAQGPPGWTRIAVAGEPDWIAFEGDEVLPRLFLARRIERVGASELGSALARIDAADTALLDAEATPPDIVALAPPAPSDRLELVAHTGRSYRLRAELAQARLVATSLLEPEGWRVAIDGRPVPTLTVHGAFLGFVAPASAQAIEVRYRPPGLLAGGIAASAGALGAWLFAATARPGRRRRT